MVISSNFFNSYMTMSFPFSFASQRKSKLFRTNSWPYKVLHVWSCLLDLTNTFHFHFSFQFPHTSLSFQTMIIELSKHFPIFFLSANFYLSFKCQLQDHFDKTIPMSLIRTILPHSYCRETCFHYINY